MKIEDNFLEQKDLVELQNVMMGNQERHFWCYAPFIDYVDDVDKFQFSHLFYADPVPRSECFNNLIPILDIIHPVALLRIKANLLTRTPKIVENKFHIDIQGASEEKLGQWTTSIFYVNTNNGYTKFEDGTKVESVANRLVTFPANLKHTGSSCTDEKIRVSIGFNYFK